MWVWNWTVMGFAFGVSLAVPFEDTREGRRDILGCGFFVDATRLGEDFSQRWLIVPSLANLVRIHNRVICHWPVASGRYPN